MHVLWSYTDLCGLLVTVSFGERLLQLFKDTTSAAGQAPSAWAIGARCQAYSSVDGDWYTATVTGVSASDNFVVQLDQGGPEEEVSCRPYVLDPIGLQVICPHS